MNDRGAELAARVRAAHDEGGKLRIEGGGSYAGFCPVAANVEVLSTREHRGIVDYDPTEMVVTVRAGTPLVELERVLADAGQQLGVECPHLSERATVGGALAMGFSGSSRPFTGALCDYVLGVRLLNGAGEDLNFGGRVMKNVAGYDFPRLMVGSRGELGVLLDLSLRVTPRPEKSLFLSFDMPRFREAVEFADRLIAGAEPLTGACYCRGRLYLRCAGREETVDRLRRTLGGEPLAERWWSQLRDWKMPWGKPAHLGYRDMRFREPRSGADWLADWNGGLVWSTVREPSADVAIELSARNRERGPRGQLERRLRGAFDPHGVFTVGAG